MYWRKANQKFETLFFQIRRAFPDWAAPGWAALGWISILFALHSACMPEPLEVKGVPEVEPRIVVATQMLSDQAFVVWLTRTFGALDADEDSDPEELLKQLAVNDAVVTLTGPEGADTLSFIEHGVYGGIFIPFEEGQAYELNIYSETLGKVAATTIVQSQVVFEKIDASLYYDIYDDTLLQVNYSFHDPAERNWYMLNVQKVGEESFKQNIINPEAYTHLLEDTEFNGLLYEKEFDYSVEDYAPGDTVAISLSAISEEYYRFMKLRINNRLSFLEFLSEPVNYPSNVEGGKGFFNLYIPDIRTFVLKEDE